MHTIVRTGRARGGHWLYCSCGWVSQPVRNAAEVEAAHASHRVGLGQAVAARVGTARTPQHGVLSPA